MNVFYASRQGAPGLRFAGAPSFPRSLREEPATDQREGVERVRQGLFARTLDNADLLSSIRKAVHASLCSTTCAKACWFPIFTIPLSILSISLDPYQRLVKQLVNDQKPEELAKYTQFVIDSVNRVFASPTERIFDEHHREKGTSPEKLLKGLREFLEPLLAVLKK
jgi:hypothetical protein